MSMFYIFLQWVDVFSRLEQFSRRVKSVIVIKLVCTTQSRLNIDYLRFQARMKESVIKILGTMYSRSPILKTEIYNNFVRV